MATQSTLTFGGDATALEKAAARARAATEGVGAAARRASDGLQEGARAAQEQESRLTRLGAVSAGTSAAVGDLGASVGSVNDVMNRGRDRAMEHARALADLEQAQLDAKQAAGDLEQAQNDVAQALVDVKQAGRDAAQSAIDVEQAQLDAEQAASDYAAAVREHGKGSIEARQALIDQKQAQEDLRQAQLDAEQATVDQTQAQLDGGQAVRDAAQAQRDAADAALNMADAQRQANPGTMSTLARDAELAAGVLAGAAGAVNLLAMAHGALSLATIRSTAATAAAKVAAIAGAAATGIATAAQWLWNIAMTANPIGLIIVAVGALVAAIIVIATKTTWFQTIWKAVWGAIVAYIKWVANNYKAAFNAIVSAGSWLLGKIKAIGSGIKNVFTRIGSAISAPFRSAFNAVARAWNNTIGRLSWSVPSWVPGIGGASISAPKLPTMHTGGRVPGTPGQEVLALLQAGETVTPAGQTAGRAVIEIRSGGARLDDLLVEILLRSLRTNPAVRAAVAGSRG